MFDSSNPPLLVQSIHMQHSTLFSQHEGYNIHLLSSDQALVSYKDGWTFPLSIQQRKYITKPPLFLVRNKGRITTEGSTFSKGYAHQFCNGEGGAPLLYDEQEIFSDQPDIKWMLIPDTVTMIWLQYGNKNQYCGDSSFEMERIYYGKLIIRKFTIQEDYAPRLDKNADNTNLCAKQYRVQGCDLYNDNYNTIDQEPEAYLRNLLASQKLDPFIPAVVTALKKASTPI